MRGLGATVTVGRGLVAAPPGSDAARRRLIAASPRVDLPRWGS
jgi:hypothetical protein